MGFKTLVFTAIAALMQAGAAQGQTQDQAPDRAPAPALDVAMDAAGVERFAPSEWQTVKLDLSGDQLSLAWEGMDLQTRRKLLDALTGCRTFIATNPKTQSVFNLTVMVFADSGTAGEAVGALEAMTRTNVESGAIPKLKPEGVRYGRLEGINGAFVSSTVDFTTEVSEATALTLHAARVAKQNVVVEFMRINHEVPVQDARQVIAALFDAVLTAAPETGSP